MRVALLPSALAITAPLVLAEYNLFISGEKIALDDVALTSWCWFVPSAFINHTFLPFT